YWGEMPLWFQTQMEMGFYALPPMKEVKMGTFMQIFPFLPVMGSKHPSNFSVMGEVEMLMVLPFICLMLQYQISNLEDLGGHWVMATTSTRVHLGLPELI